MASIGSDPNGRKRILFVAGDGRRMTVRLGKMSAKQADAFKVKVEDLIGAANGAGMVHDETSRWLAGLDDKMHARLVAVGLAKPRNGGGTALLGPFIDAYLKTLPRAKEHTLLNWQQVRKWMVDFFGETRDVRTVTAADAEDWTAHMRAGNLGDNTIRRHTGRARQLFKAAIRRGVVRGANPFEGMAATVRADKARQFFVTRDAAAKVLDACPDAQWRLLFALSRYGGLRCPSEHLALKWSDVDWEKNRVRVPSPKTEHHEGKDCRYIPLFPELRPYLLEVFEAAEPGTEYVISRYRDGYGNLRTQLGRIIRKAGLTVWAKPWHNLRATRQTELAERYPLHVVCAWIGNSRAVAQEHYLQVTDAHFAAASAAQNPAQTAADTSGPEKTAENAKAGNAQECPAESVAVCSGPDEKYPRQGLNTRQDFGANQRGSLSRGTESGTPPADPDLQAVIDAWPTLPTHVRQMIRDLIRDAK